MMEWVLVAGMLGVSWAAYREVRRLRETLLQLQQSHAELLARVARQGFPRPDTACGLLQGRVARLESQAAQDGLPTEPWRTMRGV